MRPCQVFERNFLDLLNRFDHEAMAQYCTINHHVDGMDYLCLQRDPQGKTYKLYIIDKPSNPNSGWLVNPHTHRYAFTSFMFRGRLQHIRFRKRQYGVGLQQQRDWVECLYSPEDGRVEIGNTFLRPYQTEHIEEGDDYIVGPNEIHTLKLYDDGEPVLIGLIQGPDEKERSHLFLPANEWPHMNRPNSMRCMPHMAKRLQQRALQLIGA